MLDAHAPAEPQDLMQTRSVQQLLGMQQLGPHGLSEQWALGFCGDVHWGLIAQSFGQESLCFQTRDGRPLYAAFCATRLELALTGSLLGESLTIQSDLTSLGGPKVGSRHVFIHRGQEIGRLLMLSIFVAHDETGSNRRITRALPAQPCNLPPAGAELRALEKRAQHMSRDLRRRAAPPVTRAPLTPQFTLDFNAVGLLYFPSFSRIIEQSTACTSPLRMREVTYLGNLDPGDTVYTNRQGAETLVTRGSGQIIAHACETRHE